MGRIHPSNASRAPSTLASDPRPSSTAASRQLTTMRTRAAAAANTIRMTSTGVRRCPTSRPEGRPAGMAPRALSSRRDTCVATVGWRTIPVGGLAGDAMTPRRYLVAGCPRGDSDTVTTRQRPCGEGRCVEEERVLSAGLAPTGELVPWFIIRNAPEAGIVPKNNLKRTTRWQPGRCRRSRRRERGSR